MRILPIPCLSDNYAYLVHREGSDEAIVVDPSESEPVLRALDAEGLRLVAILNTHHHHDHVGGNEGLRARLGELPVYAHASDAGRVPAQTERVEEGQVVRAAGLEFTTLHVPGHTLGAVSYQVEDAVFTGDTLFIGGCGRLFEGTPEGMVASLGKLAALPPSTRVFCGHEYTVNNLRFAHTVEPDNEAISRKLTKAQEARERGEPTVGSTMGEELETNPFLRCDASAVRARFPGDGRAEVFAAVRRAKDSFR
ncbi:hydroxyacylglutathione hydrolase [Chondromyces apiculatus]|uniref:Hydroxyacylglutathione hydrolase n=1 Tax=Chondromyces apiculatus DSM 436 TaxID=1192034 RepID=A0A017TCV1_9BACT|nr:hydroxyacylglutathione hydrolase [Chondromyces apiculatus]EYF06640.1 Hydroxyacylglutathione hydrolase [Chondromyces apiculatus DSM 436]